MIKIETEAGHANAEQGQVTLDGPDGIVITMTSKAAKETGESLTDAARVAERQKDHRSAQYG